MPTQLIPGEDDEAAIMAAIGHVCIQWALLENNLMAILTACQSTSWDEAALLFGSLDMKPRLNTAILLARHHKWPPPVVKRLESLRTNIDKSKLVDRRNLIVHGVHSASDLPQSFNLYTPRRKGEAQHETWTVMDAYRVGQEARAAALEAYDIFAEYGRRKFGRDPAENFGSQLMTAPALRRARIKQYVRARLHRLLW
jgi:hypothetical protein